MRKQNCFYPGVFAGNWHPVYLDMQMFEKSKCIGKLNQNLLSNIHVCESKKYFLESQKHLSKFFSLFLNTMQTFWLKDMITKCVVAVQGSNPSSIWISHHLSSVSIGLSHTYKFIILNFTSDFGSLNVIYKISELSSMKWQKKQCLWKI
jgi:hypothetical protein